MSNFALIENLEGRRMLHGGLGDGDFVSMVPPAGPKMEAEAVLAYNGLDPVIVAMFSDPDSIEPEEWRTLEKVYVVPESVRGAQPTENPGEPMDVVPADQFQVITTGNGGYFSENYDHLNVGALMIFGVGHAETPEEIDYEDLRDRLQIAVDEGRTPVFDVEHLKVDIDRHSTDEVDRSMLVYQAVIDFARAEFPEVQIGFYGTFPIRDYWTPIYYRRALESVAEGRDDFWAANIQRYTDRYMDWQASNDYLAPLARQVDVIYPSLYTFSDDPQEWQWYAEESIKQAERFGKPVIPFLWNRYHQSNQDLKWQTIDGDFWRLQLDTVRANAAGVAIWDFSAATSVDLDVAADYSTNNAWYNQTVDFFEDIFEEANPDDE
ncbi:MAG: hypothetical protein AAGD32_15165 [Planctomycetota bacterium]